jgi:hypothetical protein
MAAYLGHGDTFDRTMAAFAEVYADQNERDHSALKSAIAEGRIEATQVPDGQRPAARRR